MPIISKVGTRSLAVRGVFAAIYILLTAGAVTMIYPMLLMLSGSVKSAADFNEIRILPRYWIDDLALFQKYAEAKYNGNLELCRDAWNQPVLNWLKIKTPPEVPEPLLRDFAAWRDARWALQPDVLGHAQAFGLLPQNARRYRARLHRAYAGDLDRYIRETGQLVSGWSHVLPPVEIIGRYHNLALPANLTADFDTFKRTRPAHEGLLANPEGTFAWGILAPAYAQDITAYNAAHGAAYPHFGAIPLPEQAPATDPARAHWEAFVRQRVALNHIRLTPELTPAWHAFLAARYGHDIERFNATHATALPAFEAIALPAALDDAPGLRIDWEAFLKDAEACPLDAVRLHTPETAFRMFLQERHGAIPQDLPPFGTLVAALDYRDCMAMKFPLRTEFATRNYKQVINYIGVHGNGIRNTVIYCVLAVFTALLVNPLAAYALSRFKLPGTYKILLFCMATMAFPAEVAMIPSFILLRRFPLWPLLAGIATLLAVFLLLEKTCPRWSEKWRALAALAAAVLVGAGLVPALFPEAVTVSLLNTFAALILPGMASGFSIFLLKGFFDSLPKELYEAADLDGAGEWTKFWLLTMNLSKPILAVIALSAFTTAYSAFMMALVIIPDQKMWTIMVWIYQLQEQVHTSVVYASLVIAALPTFAIFVVCQNVIMRGIVVPTEK